MKNPANVAAAIGLFLGAVFGMLGTMVAERNLQAAFWAVDGVAVVVATALLALRFFRTGNDVVAAGFLVFTIGESVFPAALFRVPLPGPHVRRLDLDAADEGWREVVRSNPFAC